MLVYFWDFKRIVEMEKKDIFWKRRLFFFVKKDEIVKNEILVRELVLLFFVGDVKNFMKRDKKYKIMKKIYLKIKIRFVLCVILIVKSI